MVENDGDERSRSVELRLCGELDQRPPVPRGGERRRARVGVPVADARDVTITRVPCLVEESAMPAAADVDAKGVPLDAGGVTCVVKREDRSSAQ